MLTPFPLGPRIRDRVLMDVVDCYTLANDAVDLGHTRGTTPRNGVVPTGHGR